jgi:hypothetical protein
MSFSASSSSASTTAFFAFEQNKHEVEYFGVNVIEGGTRLHWGAIIIQQ